MGSNTINCDQLAAADRALMAGSTGRSNPINCADIHPPSGRVFSADFLRVEDLVSMLEVSRSQIDRACREYRVSRGRSGLAHCKLGRGFLFRRAAVDAWLQSMEVANRA
jgi:hypothetical protein